LAVHEHTDILHRDDLVSEAEGLLALVDARQGALDHRAAAGGIDEDAVGDPVGARLILNEGVGRLESVGHDLRARGGLLQVEHLVRRSRGAGVDRFPARILLDLHVVEPDERLGAARADQYLRGRRGLIADIVVDVRRRRVLRAIDEHANHAAVHRDADRVVGGAVERSGHLDGSGHVGESHRAVGGRRVTVDVQATVGVERGDETGFQVGGVPEEDHRLAFAVQAHLRGDVAVQRRSPVDLRAVHEAVDLRLDVLEVVGAVVHRLPVALVGERREAGDSGREREAVVDLRRLRGGNVVEGNGAREVVRAKRDRRLRGAGPRRVGDVSGRLRGAVDEHFDHRTLGLDAEIMERRGVERRAERHRLQRRVHAVQHPVDADRLVARDRDRVAVRKLRVHAEVHVGGVGRIGARDAHRRADRAVGHRNAVHLSEVALGIQSRLGIPPQPAAVVGLLPAAAVGHGSKVHRTQLREVVAHGREVRAHVVEPHRAARVLGPDRRVHVARAGVSVVVDGDLLDAVDGHADVRAVVGDFQRVVERRIERGTQRSGTDLGVGIAAVAVELHEAVHVDAGRVTVAAPLVGAEVHVGGVGGIRRAAVDADLCLNLAVLGLEIFDVREVGVPVVDFLFAIRDVAIAVVRHAPRALLRRKLDGLHRIQIIARRVLRGREIVEDRRARQVDSREGDAGLRGARINVVARLVRVREGGSRGAIHEHGHRLVADHDLKVMLERGVEAGEDDLPDLLVARTPAVVGHPVEAQVACAVEADRVTVV